MHITCIASPQVGKMSALPVQVEEMCFAQGRHSRVDETLQSIVAGLSQAPQVCAPVHHQRKSLSRRSKMPHGSESHTKRSGPERNADKWVRAETRKHRHSVGLTVQGVCNRISERNLDHLQAALSDLIIKELEVSHDPLSIAKDRLCTILNSMATSDGYVHLFVRIVETICCKDCSQTLQHALAIQAHDFTFSRPYMLSHPPSATDDYNAFCQFVKEKRKRVNLCAAYVQLGFLGDILQMMYPATHLLLQCQKPQSYQPDLLIKMMQIVVRASPEYRAHVRTHVPKALQNNERCGADAMTRFALMDLLEEAQSEKEVLMK